MITNDIELEKDVHEEERQVNCGKDWGSEEECGVFGKEGLLIDQNHPVINLVFIEEV